VSGPDLRHPSPAAGIRLASLSGDIVELAAFRNRSADLERLAAARGVALPARGHIASRRSRLTLSVRPDRWLLLTAPASEGASAWEQATGGCGAAVDLSAALAATVLSGPAVREMLTRSCRLDLAAEAFPAGRAAATIMVQVPVILAALSGAMLLLTPATTARHVHEWLVTTSQPFGLILAPQASPADFYGDNSA
jgi:heterotetrameric sarcosine oxidase gamma subunit